MRQSTVFISYSHKDEREKDKLLSHLGVLQGEGLIGLWSDDRIQAGADWEREIEEAMAQARVAILLVSANFLTSEFILGQEVPTLLQRRQSEGLTVFPVIARPCAWQEVGWLAGMNVRPKNGRAIWGAKGRQVDEDLAAIAEELAAIIKIGSPITSTASGVYRKPETAQNTISKKIEEGTVKEGNFDLVTSPHPTSSGVPEKSQVSINIGNIGGDFSGNVAGRDINIRQINQAGPANKAEALTELKQLLANIQQQLAEITAQQEALKAISPEAPFDAQAVEAAIKAMTEKVAAGMDPETAKTGESSLKRAAQRLSDLLEGAATVAQKAGQVGEAVKPIAEKLTPLVENIGRAILLLGPWLGT